jgi:hypothetical protein
MPDLLTNATELMTTYWPTDWLVGQLADWLNVRMNCWMAYLTDRLADWLAELLLYWWTDYSWPTDRLRGQLVDRFTDWPAWLLVRAKSLFLSQLVDTQLSASHIQECCGPVWLHISLCSQGLLFTKSKAEFIKHNIEANLYNNILKKSEKQPFTFLQILFQY